MMATIVSFGILLSVVIMHITFALQATEELGNNPQKMQITQQSSFTFSRQSSMTKPGSPFSSLPESNEKNLPSHIPGERDLNFKAVHRSRRGVLSWFASYFQSDSETTEEPTKLDQTTSDIKDQEQSLAQTETTTLSEFTGNSEKEPVKPAQNRLHNPIDKPSGNDVEQQGTTREPRSTESIPVTDFLRKLIRRCGLPRCRHSYIKTSMSKRSMSVPVTCQVYLDTIRRVPGTMNLPTLQKKPGRRKGIG